MSLIIEHEYYRELLTGQAGVRDVEADAPEADLVGEKVYSACLDAPEPWPVPVIDPRPMAVS